MFSAARAIAHVDHDVCSPCNDPYAVVWKSYAIRPDYGSMFPNVNVEDDVEVPNVDVEVSEDVESRTPKVRRAPTEPTREEIILHDALHHCDSLRSIFPKHQMFLPFSRSV